MPDRIVSAFAKALFSRDMVSARIILGISEMWWAVLLWWPGDTFGRPTYALMAEVMPEDCWGAVFFMTSIMQFSIVGKEQFHSREARWFAAYNMALWVGCVLSMLKSVYPPPAAISAEITMASASIWIWLEPHLERRWIIKSWKAVYDRQVRGM